MNLKKSVKIFGKVVPVWAITTLVMAGLGSAALVGYISNKVQANVSVTSPMEQFIGTSIPTDNKNPLSFDVKGGETVDFYVITKNNANVPITGNPANIVTNAGGVTCADFQKVEARTSSDGGSSWSSWYDITSACSSDGGYTVKFVYGPSPKTWPASPYADTNEIKATFKTDALGTYVFSSQILPA